MATSWPPSLDTIYGGAETISRRVNELSGGNTPVENRVSELWALMDFLNPRVLGEEDFFRQRYRLPIERYGDMSSKGFSIPTSRP